MNIWWPLIDDGMGGTEQLLARGYTSVEVEDPYPPDIRRTLSCVTAGASVEVPGYFKVSRQFSVKQCVFGILVTHMYIL